MLIVTKFGGSSCADSKQFMKVKAIIEADPLRRVVVVSALGKRNKTDNKITDLLYLLAAHIKYGVDYSNILKMIYDRYMEIKKDLNLKIDLEQEFSVIEKSIKNKATEEYLVSRGEYLCAKMMAEYLNFDFADAYDLIKFKYDGTVDDEKTNIQINERIIAYPKIVVPGFYGAYPNGRIKLFSRGGSDITGSLLAKALNATKYENWTDVSGILMADPKIIDNPKRIKEVTYEELRELSYMGASVLHEETIFPIQDLNIPIHILNTNRPEDEGTIICKEATESSQVITGISGKKNFTSFTIIKDRTANKMHVIQDCLEVFRRFNVTIEHIPTSIDSFSLVVESKQLEKQMYDIISELKKNKDVVDVDMDEDVALVAVVGRNMVTRPGISAKIFSIFGREQINIKMIAQGAKEINIIVGISNNDFNKSIKAIYSNMILESI